MYIGLIRAKLHLNGELDGTGGRRSAVATEKSKRASILFGYGQLVGGKSELLWKKIDRVIDINIFKFDSGTMIYDPIYEIDDTDTSTDY